MVVIQPSAMVCLAGNLVAGPPVPGPLLDFPPLDFGPVGAEAVGVEVAGVEVAGLEVAGVEVAGPAVAGGTNGRDVPSGSQTYPCCAAAGPAAPWTEPITVPSSSTSAVRP